MCVLYDIENLEDKKKILGIRHYAGSLTYESEKQGGDALLKQGVSSSKILS